MCGRVIRARVLPSSLSAQRLTARVCHCLPVAFPLRRTARPCPLFSGKVLILDGLDEAVGGRPADAVPLPAKLPDGVFVLLSARPEWLEKASLPFTYDHYPLDPENDDKAERH